MLAFPVRSLPPFLRLVPELHRVKTVLNLLKLGRWEAFFGSAMRQDDDPSDTMSQGSMRSHSRSNYSTSRRHTTPSASTKSPEALGSAQQAFAVASRAGARVGMGATVARVPGLGMEPRQIPNVNIGDGASEISRDVGGLELEEGWDEKFVYKVMLEISWYLGPSVPQC